MSTIGKNSLFLVCATAATLLAGCSTPAAKSERITYENSIRQLIETRCLDCHGGDAPTMEEFKKDRKRYESEKLGPRMDSYEALMIVVNGSDAGALMRRLDDGTNTKDGKPGNMYKRLAKEEELRPERLALFKRWVGSWNLKRDKELSDDERKAVLAPRN
jgi:hypothetical protein